MLPLTFFEDALCGQLEGKVRRVDNMVSAIFEAEAKTADHVARQQAALARVTEALHTHSHRT